jgi:threonylcarbamoyladenosine tRNA methylthiotransferase CDKAL1
MGDMFRIAAWGDNRNEQTKNACTHGEQMKQKVFIEEAGCNRRKLDLKTISTYLQSNDYELVDRPEDADKILVATCAFKKLEEDESVQRLRHYKKYQAEMVVYGCLPDIAKERYEEFVDIPKVAPRELQKIEQYFPSSRVSLSSVADSNTIGKARGNVFNAITRIIQTRPTLDREFIHRTIEAGRKKYKNIVTPQAPSFYLFVCRGCLGKCSYCGIRNSIGTVHSKPLASVVAEFQNGVKNGYREFTILGDDPGCYGIDLGRTLPELLQVLLAAATESPQPHNGPNTKGKEIVFHLNEIHPKYLIPYTDKFLAIENFASVRSILCPIQSGSSRVLGLMQREHTAEQYEEAVQRIRVQLPKTAFHTQIIIGFPSETEEEFQQTLDLVARCMFDSVVIFPYDDKDRTGSSILEGKIQANVIQRRLRTAFKFFAKAGVKAYYKCP